MKIYSFLFTTASVAVLTSLPTSAAILALWTFETSIPTSAGPHLAEGGFYATTSNATTNSGGTISNPAGNGSAESFSSNGWTTGEYYQFTTSSLGYTEGITVTFAQSASGTGPGNFQFQYSTDGSTYVDFGGVYAGPTPDFSTGAARPENILTFDLSGVSGLTEAASIGFRVVVADTVSEAGGTTATTGTFRVDDFSVESIPEPTSALFGALGLLGILRRRR